MSQQRRRRRKAHQGLQALATTIRALILFSVVLPAWAVPTFLAEPPLAESESGLPDASSVPAEEIIVLHAQAPSATRRRCQGVLSLVPPERGPRLSAASCATAGALRGHRLANGLCAPLRC